MYDPMAVSTVIDKPIEAPKVQTTIATASAVSLINKKGASEGTKKVADQRRSMTGFSSKHEIERRALMQEFGGFKNKRVLSAYRN